MKHLSFATTAVLTTVSLLAACNGQTPTEPADIIFANGYVYTVDNERTVAEALAIKEGKIAFVGNTDDAMQFRGPKTVVKDLAGKMVMPGLHDMHIHALGSVKPDMCDIDGEAMSLDELVPFIQNCIKKYAVTEGEWLPVLQWNPFEGNQPSSEHPTIRAALDAASKTNPIILWGNDGHHGAANSLALNSPAIPINADSVRTTYADYKGLIAVDANGVPTGGLTEGARNIVRENMDNDMLGVSTDSPSLMPRVAAKMAATGITSLQDAAVTPSILNHYKWLDASGGMTFRLRTALRIDIDGEKLPQNLDAVDEVIEKLNTLRDSVAGSKYIDANAVKLFADGVLEGNPYSDPPTLPNAALLDGFHQPIFTINKETGNADVAGYVDTQSSTCRAVQKNPAAYEASDSALAFKAAQGYAPSQCVKQYGKLESSEAVIKDFVFKATEAGYHVHIHALADHAVKVAADAFEASKAIADQKGVTQSIAHLQIGKTEDIKRHGALGTYVTFTYSWATPEPEYEMVVVPFIDKIKGVDDLYNPENYYTRNAYPFKSIHEHGGVPVFGSDTPVGSRDPRPFRSMKAALMREAGGYTLNAAERLNIHEAIASYTISSARMMAHADKLGSLETGKLADLIVLDRNIVELAESGNTDTLGDTRVLMTVFEGNIIYEAGL